MLQPTYNQQKPQHGAIMLSSVLVFGVLGLAIALVALQPTRAATGINTVLTYQGKLLTATGVQVGNATYLAKFVIYDAASGGNCLWTAVGACDTASYGTTTVATVNGVFSIELGGTGHNSL